MARTVTFKGKTLNLAGRELKPGDKLSDFRVTGTDLNDLTKSDFEGSTLIISAVPSLDTPVCALETKRFNKEASSLQNVKILTVSMDLPFAQSRWCAAEGVQNLTVASDYKYRSFGEDFGTYIQELGLLARAVFVADKNGSIRYVQYVPEVTNEPDYDAALKAAREV